MKYENPNVVVLGSAAELVQHSQQDKGLGGFQDSFNMNIYDETVAAYQADE